MPNNSFDDESVQRIGEAVKRVEGMPGNTIAPPDRIGRGGQGMPFAFFKLTEGNLPAGGQGSFGVVEATMMSGVEDALTPYLDANGDPIKLKVYNFFDRSIRKDRYILCCWCDGKWHYILPSSCGDLFDPQSP
ncbi:MAG: hypothetical protein ABS70_00515 [Nitrospira sp. SCN 59-13]|nr:MAG: hypothetical protein ABS70_00515 [Nitrospira sp. SCN 59-13]